MKSTLYEGLIDLWKRCLNFIEEKHSCKNCGNLKCPRDPCEFWTPRKVK